MSGSGTSVGAVSVTLEGDAKPVVDAFTKATDVVEDFEEKLKKTSDAAGKVTSRVDELRNKQEQLTRALVAAAGATERDEAKVRALRNELESVTGSLNRLTSAQQVSVATQQKIHTAQTAAVGSTKNLGGAVLELSRGFEDAQYGMAGILNNIPSLITQLGGSMGLAGIISIAAVGVSVFVKNWDDLAPAVSAAVAASRAHVEELEGDLKLLKTTMDAITGRQNKADARLVGALTGITDDDARTIRAVKSEADGLEAELRALNQLEQRPGLFSSWLEDDHITAAREKLGELRKEVARLEAAYKLVEQREGWSGRGLDIKADAKSDKAAEKADQKSSDRAVTIANKEEAAYQRSLKAQGRAAERELTPMQEYDAIKAIFADIKQNQAGGRSTASWANPEVSPERAVELSGVAETMTIHADMTQAELDGLTSSFGVLDTEVIDTRTALERFGDEMANVDWGALGTDAAATAASGNLAGAGSALGSAAGTAVGNMVMPGIGGAIGGGLGSALGGMMGGALEELIESLGVLTPLFDAITLIIGALAPIFMVIGVLMEAVGGVLVALVPIIAALAEPIAALLLVVVRIVEALLPFVNIVLLAVGVLVAFLEVITMGVQWLDTNFFRPLSSAAAYLYNGFVDTYNAFIDFIRNIPGFSEFGIKMNSISTLVEDVIDGFADNVDELGAVMGDTAEETKGVARSMSNVPSWYRTPLAEYRSAEGRNAPGTINIGTINLTTSSPTIEGSIRRDLMRRTGAPLPRRRDDETN